MHPDMQYNEETSLRFSKGKASLIVAVSPFYQRENRLLTKPLITCMPLAGEGEKTVQHSLKERCSAVRESGEVVLFGQPTIGRFVK